MKNKLLTKRIFKIKVYKMNKNKKIISGKNKKN